ncbi:metal ABC transporter solute-binding protein, Zn/Mn family [Psychromicrobium xiongbiense]|uniref:metal ABC transporter solute-binding protein, Zn/Mn family n=1 Tax=Psychromicrobium xiongbiense TaxID=3051184 RepID=UPI0025531443|nr:zinc ABC transporter substrate-binding protein [Psychromicrobium sp. YIM S02556]
MRSTTARPNAERISPTRRLRLPALIASGLAAVVVLSACGTAAPAASSSSAGSQTGVIDVVASTNVYGNIAATIGGPQVKVTSLIASSSQDPHSYEATAQDKLAVSKAGLLIENGGGYDDFFSKLSESADPSTVIDVVKLSGLKKDGDTEFNEHVWYSFPTVSALADQIAARLGAKDAAHAQDFTSRAADFKKSLDALSGQVSTLKAKDQGQPVAITEPVPLYLLSAVGLVNKTPEEYSHAIEQGTDVPATVLKETSELISSKGVRLLAYNPQTEGPQTLALKKAADAAGVPVVNFTETLPEGQTYLQWMTQNVENLGRALA